MNDLRNKAARKLNDVLRAMIQGETIFPLPIRIAKPKITAPLSEWRDTISLIRSQSRESLGFGYTVEWEIVNSKRHGKNEFPAKLSFASLDDFLKYVGAENEAQALLSNVGIMCEWDPGAKSWCAGHLALMRKPAEAIQNAIKILTYLKANPAPGLYARQLPIQVPTKYLEQERPLLEELAHEFAPECLIQEDGTLEERLGLMTKESLIEFRSLDHSIKTLPFGHAMATARELASNDHYFDEFECVIVVENHVPFLTLPDLPKTLAIMGNGFAVHRLSKVPWLSGKTLFYWGDIDLSGFSILAKFRESHPIAASVMMDQTTLDRFSDLQQYHKADQTIQDSQLKHLSAEEDALVDKLKLNGGLRLEQEHIDYSYVSETLMKLIQSKKNN
ncbi:MULTISPECIES: Wadjet anti-phage system protein JetD domain-containing protein [unclassified Lentimonas]|uniref:Wadjet anti-phage system protein JetD domain-containing protein n=1 Tax=unclassified Lentimonas TaxID=2630993 RepID=UPI0013896ACB|nr:MULTISPECIES: DUF3322 and DUF2220 domain-containing protein [unclassified Lentimonas]